MPTPSSSSGPPEPCGASARCSAASSATSPARSSADRNSQTCSRCRSRGLAGSRISASASVAGSSTRCMLPRSSALAKARPTNPKAHKPYEFGVKVSVATPLNRCRGGQFVAHAKALPGNPYDGHTLAAVLPDIESTIGAGLERIVTDAGYKGHNAPKHQRFKVYVAGQRRGLTAAIKRAFRRRSAVEPTIGHLKNEHRMGRNHLAGRAGDAANAVLAAVGYNFRLLLRWLALLLRIVLAVLAASSHSNRTIAAS